jgi:hypothetical protein
MWTSSQDNRLCGGVDVKVKVKIEQPRKVGEAPNGTSSRTRLPPLLPTFMVTLWSSAEAYCGADSRVSIAS